MRYRDLVEDGHIPGLLVHPDWYEPRHPQELPIDVSDAIPLWNPAPELSVPEGEFDTLPEWDAWVPTNCPASPQNLRYFENTTLASDAIVDQRRYHLEDAINWTIGDCMFIELDGGGWFVAQVTIDFHNCPSFVIESNRFFQGVASAGNDVFVGSGNLNIPRLNGAWSVDPGGV